MEETSKRKFSNVKIGTVLIVSFLVIYIPSLLHWAGGVTIYTEVIRNGTLEDTLNAEGYFVRSEEVFKAPFEGTFIPEEGEGDKVPIHYNIATVLKKSSEKLLEDMKVLDLKILEAQKQKEDQATLFSEDVRKIDGQIGEKLAKVIAAGNNNDLDAAGALKEEIDGLMQKKASILGNSGTPNEYIRSLQKQKETLQNRIDNNTVEIISKSPGIISFFIDGYEEMLTPASIKNLTPSFLDSIKEGSRISRLNSKIAAAQEPFMKIIKDFEYHMLVPLPKALAKDYEKGQRVEIRINELNKSLIGSVDTLSKVNNGKFILSIKIDDYISETAGIRRTNVDLIIKHYEGLMVPLSALKDINLQEMKAKIVVVDANYAKIKDVKIKAKDSDFAIIDNPDEKDKNGVRLYSIYVTKPENIKEGQLISP